MCFTNCLFVVTSPLQIVMVQHLLVEPVSFALVGLINEEDTKVRFIPPFFFIFEIPLSFFYLVLVGNSFNLEFY